MSEAELLASVREVVAAAKAALDSSRVRIDDLNVYPVPDGDTGTNLAQTVARIASALDDAEPAPAPQLAFIVRDAALRGAKGNSGVILSQILRGFCDSLGEQPALGAPVLAEALRGASDTAYRGVPQPVEGTILTVIREMAEEAEDAAEGCLDDALDRVLARAEDALARTPELLARLREAGVVDAGGAGLVEVARGAIAGLRGEELPAPLAAAVTASADHEHAEASRYRYCTNFIVAGEKVAPGALERALTPLGDCLIVVGDAAATRVHLHTDDPGRALSLAVAVGGISAVEVADMHEQIVERARRLERPSALRLVAGVEERRSSDVVFVGAGEGNARLAASAGARRVVNGGQSMNPSTEELLAAIESAAADAVLLLPNNRNVVMAAQQAAAASSVRTEVVETSSIPQGLAALIAYRPDGEAADNARAMRRAAAGVRVGELTRAVRATTVDGLAVADGDFIGLVDGSIAVADRELDVVVEALVHRLVDDGREVLTALSGEDVADAKRALAVLEAVIAARDDLELEVHEGGQPHYPLLLSAE